MTATTSPPDKTDRPAKRAVRISYMETLGFSDATNVWSDSPIPSRPSLDLPQRGRHEAAEPKPDLLDGWQPSLVGKQLEQSNIRWTRVAALFLLIVAVGAAAFLVYREREAETLRASVQVQTQATTLLGLLDPMSDLNAALLAAQSPGDTNVLTAVDESARALFNGSSSVEGRQRSLAGESASSALDAAQTLGDAIAYRRAVTPLLVPPVLETDPSLIDLDEAARAFGDWQLGFDSIRTALPDGLFTDVTGALDILSGNLSVVLSGYVDALRMDDAGTAIAQLDVIGEELARIEVILETTLVEVQLQVEARIEETRTTLGSLLG